MVAASPDDPAGTYYGAGHHKLPPFSRSRPLELTQEEHARRSAAQLAALEQLGVDLPTSGFIFGAFSNLGKLHMGLWM
eukprot:746308-Hanusia_phi.AAC.1